MFFPGVVVFEYGEEQKLVLIKELRFFYHLVEQGGNMLGWVPEGATAQGPQHEGIVAVRQPDAEDGADLVLDRLSSIIPSGVSAGRFMPATAIKSIWNGCCNSAYPSRSLARKTVASFV